MSDTMVKETGDTFDDTSDDLRGLANDTGEITAVSESSVEVAQDEKATGEMPVAAETANEVAQDEKATGEMPVVAEEKSPVGDGHRAIPPKTDTPEPVAESIEEKVAVSVVKQEKAESVDTPPKAAPVVEKTETPETSVESLAANTSTNDEDAYHPSFALRVFTFFRNFFIRLFDVILTGVAIVVEAIAGLNWAGYAQAIRKVFASIHNVIPQKFRLSLYAVVVVALLGFPITWGVRTFALGNNADNPASAQNVTINQNNATVIDNGILAPLFTPTVQYWADDIAAWTSNSSISPDLLATVMQLQSCGNASVQGGLFGIGDDEASFNDPENQAMLAIETLENALIVSEGDLAMALAIYAEGDTILNTDFARWSLEARDMYILGRNIHQEAQNGGISSGDLNSWLQNTGAVLCTEAQTTRSN